jgi:hypothetical protein
MVGTSQETGDLLDNSVGAGTFKYTFQAASATTWLTLRRNVDNGTTNCDNVTIDEVPALDGWEVNADGELSIVGGELRVTNTSGTGGALATKTPRPSLLLQQLMFYWLAISRRHLLD